MYVRIGPQRKLGVEELMLLNCGAREDSWESLDSKEMKPVNPKGYQPWIFIGRTGTEAEVLILWLPDKKSWLFGKALMLGKIEGTRTRKGWNGWMDVVWANSGREWRTGKPGVLQLMGLQRIGHNLATEQQKQQALREALSLFHFYR